MSVIIAALQNGELCGSRTDGFFRYHDGEATEVKSAGDQQTIYGWFTLRCVTETEIAAYVSEHGDPWISEVRNFSPGWYVDVRGEDGRVWAFSYRGTGTLAEEAARRDYDSLERAFNDYCADINEEEEDDVQEALTPAQLDIKSQAVIEAMEAYGIDLRLLETAHEVQYQFDGDGQVTFFIEDK